ncbi:hypothetical protein HYV91_01070 [Candidatus Wolfebacteria bacterium]|nr:hypothetical protein [Candidatus Wolfebacteria bacterium]
MKTGKIILSLIIGAVVILGTAFYFKDFSGRDSYWAVYLTTGDIYFGKLSYFPRPALTDVWFLDRSASSGDNSLRISKFTQAFWLPEDKIYLNNKNIIWKTRLQAASPILESIKNGR